MNAFDKQFGVWDAEEQDYVLPTSWLALFNSLNFLGFGFGKAATPSTQFPQLTIRQGSSLEAGSASTTVDECVCSS